MKKTKLVLALCFAGSMTHAQMISTVAGTGYGHGTQNLTGGFSGDGGQATAAKLWGPVGVAFDASGNLYISDDANYRIRKVTASGVISTFAGNGTNGYSGDGGQATAAKLNSSQGITVDPSGNLYIVDFASDRIRKVNASGVISTFAGNGTSGFSGDGGQATAAEFNHIYGIAADATGNIYVADNVNNRVRKINSSGVISTIAGNGTGGFSGDGGQATSANLSVQNITCDASGNLYIADGSRVRKVNSSGVISTIAGNGMGGYSGDGGQATSAGINAKAIAIDGSGNLYIADNTNMIIRKVNTSGVISTFAGNGTEGYTGDGGIASSAEMDLPSNITINSSGNLFIADHWNNCVRAVFSTCPANAGPNIIDQQDGCGNWGVTIGTPAVINMGYSWSPSGAGNISGSNTIAQPKAIWSNTATPQVYTVTVSYSLCTTATSTVQVTAVKSNCAPGCCRMAYTGIDAPNQTTTNFIVYPNPSSEQVTMSLYDKVELIQVIDMLGRLVFETKNTDAGEFKLDVSKYNKGIYFIRVKMGNTIEKQKLIIE